MWEGGSPQAFSMDAGRRFPSPIVRQHYRIYKKFTERGLTTMRKWVMLAHSVTSRHGLTAPFLHPASVGRLKPHTIFTTKTSSGCFCCTLRRVMDDRRI